MNSSLFALNALNFFMADVQAGLGPFLGVFLQARHWSPGQIGIAMTVGGISGMVVTTPLGALVDRTHAKRAIVVAAAILITLAAIAILLRPDFAIVATAQVATGVAGAAIGPAIAAITLGLVRQQGFPRQLGRNEAFNHSGNVFAAVLAGISGYFFGLGAVFVVLAAMATFSVAAALGIDARRIDHQAARGAGDDDDTRVASFTVLLQSKELVVLGTTLTLFILVTRRCCHCSDRQRWPTVAAIQVLLQRQRSSLPRRPWCRWLCSLRGSPRSAATGWSFCWR
jgi:MFS family permease